MSPQGSGVTITHFRLLAISQPTLDLKPTATAGDVLRTAQPHAIQRAELVGSYYPSPKVLRAVLNRAC